MIKLIGYPKCSTCKNAEKFLKDNKLDYKYINIKNNTPSIKELDNYIKLSLKNINKFFNTSGLLYRKMSLKDKINNMTYEEKLKLLSSDGMLIKRPILVLNDKVLLGFKKEEWEKILNEK